MAKDQFLEEGASADEAATGVGGLVTEGSGGALIAAEGGTCLWHPTAIDTPLLTSLPGPFSSPLSVTALSAVSDLEGGLTVGLLLGILGLIVGLVIIVLTYRILKVPWSAPKLGIAIVILAIASFFLLGSGAILGSALAVAGGFLNRRYAQLRGFR